ncbi:MAG TPA: DNA translocase FtsK 4TM domain-containing protein [Polyangiaceae bacterium]|nr:DNA translocase FtsK 4TM domain-containing protein [Polyangiaceae bacterium]
MRAHLFTPRRLVEEPAEVSTASAGKLREASSLLLIAGAAYLVLALAGIRIDPNDLSVQGADWGGAVGTGIGMLLARGFGFAAWFVPVELGVVALPLFRPGRMPVTSLRLAGDLVLMILVASLVHIAAPDAAAFGGGTSGGNVGLFFGELMRALFSAIGSFLVGGTAVGLILIGRSQLSFIAWIDRLGRAALWIKAKVFAAFGRVGGAWREAKIVRQEREDEARASALPVIDVRSKDDVILAHLEDTESDWLPIDKTGDPPIALSQALRDAITQRDVALVAAGMDPVPGASQKSEAPPSVAPRKRARKSRDESLFALEDDEPIAEVVPEPAPPPRVPASEPKAPKAEGGPLEPTIIDTSPEREVKRAQKRPERRKNGFQLPSTDLLTAAAPSVSEVDKRRVFELSERLERTLLDYGVVGKVVEIHPGPTVTTYEVAPEAGTKVSKIAGLVDDLALGLSRKVRIVAPIPGKSRIGFELPNDERQPVGLRELVEDKRFDALAEKAPLPVVLGRDIVGAPFYADLASMPHVIVAGATGAGKSVGLNVMLTSLLFRRTPDELRLLMIDPKVVELAPFDGIPHMLLPVVTDMKQASKALKWAVDEMERRYQIFANAGTKNIGNYNRWVKRIEDGEIPPPDPSEVQAIAADGQLVSVPSAKEGTDGAILPGKLPFIVIVVDEFADLMMQQGKDVETAVARLAQKARAAGMHVVLATQRPSVDVITGMIKANFPTRIAFRVAQKVDSRTILDEQGSELLLGKGDMLVKMNGSNEMRRVQCPFVSEEEVDALTNYLRSQGTPTYHDAILQRSDDDDDAPAEAEPSDPRFDEAVRIVAETRRCSTSWLQRKMTIGYNRAAKIVEMMEKLGMVGAPNGARDREVLIQPH